MRVIRRVRVIMGWLAACSALCWTCAAGAETASELAQLSIEDLANVQVTSVSKRAESVNQAPSSIFVITRDDIQRAGAVSIPEALRLAPNLEVFQTSASRYVITARGHNGAPAAQNFSNKLLVLIDGRTVYTPLFSGVYWDMQDLVTADIDRIEVISGPGATLWGANAVNGVINIITRTAAETQGGLVLLGGGPREQRLALRYGGKLSEALTYRLYAKTLRVDDTFTATGARSRDHWSKPQAGFRLDWTASGQDAVTIQGDIYEGHEAQTGAPSDKISGHNLLGRWSRALSPDAALQVQAYYDRAERGEEVGGSGFRVDTYDLDFQHSFRLGARNDVIWGGGYRSFDYNITGTGGLQWSPASRTLTLYNLFVQDTLALSPNLHLTLGAKLEDDPYVDAEFLPNARLAWTPTSTNAVPDRRPPVREREADRLRTRRQDPAFGRRFAFPVGLLQRLR
jgi:iron complex outermembrane recepter protein